MDKKNMIYIDNSATTRPLDSVIDLMSEIQRNSFGNPSSLHDMGLDAERYLREARHRIAATFAARDQEVIFNSGGTEGDNHVLRSIARSRRRSGNKIITTEVEHPAILRTCMDLEEEGFKVVKIPVDRMCRPDMEALIDAVDDETILVSVMGVNNETGTIFPVKQIAEYVHSYGGRNEEAKRQVLRGLAGIEETVEEGQKDSFWTKAPEEGSYESTKLTFAKKERKRDPNHGIVFHTDMVQGYGKLDMSDLGADFISVSSHKIHGPKGVGAVFAREGINLRPLLTGGGQEMRLRSGTENVAGIAGFALAASEAYRDLRAGRKRMQTVRDFLLEAVTSEIPDISVNSPEDSVPSVLNISFLGTRAEVILHTLEQDGIFLSTGSACSSGRKGGSHVLRAMGCTDDEIEGALRFSFSRYNTVEEMEVVVDSLKRAVTRFRRLGKFR